MDTTGTSTSVASYSLGHWVFFVPLLALHLSTLLVFVVGVSSFAMAVFLILTFVRCFGITAGFHRLLAHRSYATSRPFQFLMALFGTLAGQNGPLWWVSHHRRHHRYSDTPDDIHSPIHGFFWSHMGWLFSPHCVAFDRKLVRDLERYPEIVWLERHYYLIHGLFLVALFGLGEGLARWNPGSATSGAQLLVWGGIISTVCVYHMIWSANSVCHKFGSKRFETGDQSRNNFVVALLTLGDGWHNNHHRYPASARHGLTWWEIDLNYWILKLLTTFGIVWRLRLPRRP